jgi:hypothetical protein
MTCTIVGHINLNAYYNVKGSTPKDVNQIVNRKGTKPHDPTLHGSVTTRNDHTLDWCDWIRTQPLSGPRPSIPERVALADIIPITRKADGILERINTPGDDLHALPMPRLADITKDNTVVQGPPWYIKGRIDLGWFTSRDAARAAVRACKEAA